MRAMVFAMVIGCGEPSLAPESVASPWVTQSLDHQPDFVFALDVQGLQGDPFFGKVVDTVMQEAPLPWDRVLSARQLDGFATTRKTFTMAAYGAGPIPPDLEACIDHVGDDAELSVTHGVWVLSSRRGAAVASPTPVKMDDGALVETWLGPGAVDAGMLLARQPNQLWQHLHAVRVRFHGGASPGVLIDARFETPVDAEHAQYDLDRLEREVERVAVDVRDQDLAKRIVGELPNIKVQRNGVDLRIAYDASTSFARFVEDKMASDTPRRRAPHCAGD